MTYTEIFERVYATSRRADQEAKVTALPANVRAAWKAIQGLTDRKGFDHWWDELDEDLHDEIFAELAKAYQP